MEDESVTKKKSKVFEKATLHKYKKYLEWVLWQIKISCITVHRDIVIRLFHEVYNI